MDLIAYKEARRGDPSAPLWILRHHTPSPIHALGLVTVVERDDAERGASKAKTGRTYILAGDAEGRVSLTDLSDARPRLFWKAHSAGVLGVDIVALDTGRPSIVTSGRDNELICWKFSLSDASLESMPSRIQDDLPKPEKISTTSINALNYCAFSQCVFNGQTLVAVPHALDSGYIDVIAIPSGERIHRAVGAPDIKSRGDRAPMIMGLHLSGSDDGLLIIAGYEDGYVKRWRIQDRETELLWSTRSHLESIMAVTASSTHALSVAADEIVARYSLADGSPSTASCKSHGHASVACTSARIAVGGWDGNLRIFDPDLNRIAKLQYHRNTVQAVAMAEERVVARDHAAQSDEGTDSEEEDEEILKRKEPSALQNSTSLVLSGGKEGRICLWRLP